MKLILDLDDDETICLRQMLQPNESNKTEVRVGLKIANAILDAKYLEQIRQHNNQNQLNTD